MIQIRVCPSCGGRNIKKTQQDWTGEFRGQHYTVPDLEFYKCPDCGERIYDSVAMRKIEACSPAFVRTHTGV